MMQVLNMYYYFALFDLFILIVAYNVLILSQSAVFVGSVVDHVIHQPVGGCDDVIFLRLCSD